jgi:hypothetical protein
VVPAPAADRDSAKTGPFLGKWEFTGKDNTGLVWSGTLSIDKSRALSEAERRMVC